MKNELLPLMSGKGTLKYFEKSWKWC